MAVNLQDQGRAHRKVIYSLVVNGRDVSQLVRPLLVRLQLRESRGEEESRRTSREIPRVSRT